MSIYNITPKDTRNVIDFYKYWKTEAIKASLDKKRLNYSIICCNVIGDMNLGSIIRNSNAFLAKEVIIYGRKQWDKRGAVGTNHYQHISHAKTLSELIDKIGADALIGIDNVENATNIVNYDWLYQEHFYMVFGEEQVGIAENVLELCDEIVYIPQLGSVRSLNVGCASAIAMYDYTNKRYK